MHRRALRLIALPTLVLSAACTADGGPDEDVSEAEAPPVEDAPSIDELDAPEPDATPVVDDDSRTLLTA